MAARSSSVAVSEVESHDAALRGGAVDPVESLRLKDALTAQEKIRRRWRRRGVRPAFDGIRALAASQFDRCRNQGMSDATTSVPRVDEQAGDQPHQVVFLAWPAPQQPATAVDGSGVPRPRPARTPADRLVVQQRQHAHRVRTRCREFAEAPMVAATEPAGGELAPVVQNAVHQQCRVLRSLSKRPAASATLSAPTGRTSISTLTSARYATPTRAERYRSGIGGRARRTDGGVARGCRARDVAPPGSAEG